MNISILLKIQRRKDFIFLTYFTLKEEDVYSDAAFGEVLHLVIEVPVVVIDYYDVR